MGPTWGPLGPVGPRWAPCWPHEPCYQGSYVFLVMVSYKTWDVISISSQCVTLDPDENASALGTYGIVKMLCHVLICTEFCTYDARATQIAKFMGPTWGPPGSCWTQIGPVLAPWTLLSGRCCVYENPVHKVFELCGISTKNLALLSNLICYSICRKADHGLKMAPLGTVQFSASIKCAMFNVFAKFHCKVSKSMFVFMFCWKLCQEYDHPWGCSFVIL